MKKLLTLLLLASFSLMLVLTGCSDDDATGLSDEEVEALQQQTTLMVYGMNSSMVDGADYVNGGSALTKLARPADTSYVTYDGTTGWWYYYFESTFTYDDDTQGSISLSESVGDSVRMFDSNGDFQRSPTTDTDSLQLKSEGEMAISLTSDSESYSLEVEFEADADFGGLASDTISIDGVYAYDIYWTEGNDDYTYEFDSEYDQVLLVNTYDFSNSHPHSGTATVSMYIEDETNNESFSASITVTFSSTGYHGEMTIDGNTYTWDVTWDEVDDLGDEYFGYN